MQSESECCVFGTADNHFTGKGTPAFNDYFIHWLLYFIMMLWDINNYVMELLLIDFQVCCIYKENAGSL